MKGLEGLDNEHQMQLFWLMESHLEHWREGQSYKVVLMVITAGKVMVSNDAVTAGHLLEPGSRPRSVSPNSMQLFQAQEDGGRDWSDAYTS